MGEGNGWSEEDFDDGELNGWIYPTHVLFQIVPRTMMQIEKINF